MITGTTRTASTRTTTERALQDHGHRHDHQHDHGHQQEQGRSPDHDRAAHRTATEHAPHNHHDSTGGVLMTHACELGGVACRAPLPAVSQSQEKGGWVTERPVIQPLFLVTPGAAWPRRGVRRKVVPTVVLRGAWSHFWVVRGMGAGRLCPLLARGRGAEAGNADPGVGGGWALAAALAPLSPDRRWTGSPTRTLTAGL